MTQPTGEDPPMTARLGNATHRWAKDARSDQPTTPHQGLGSGGPPGGAGPMASAAQSMVVRTGGFQWVNHQEKMLGEDASAASYSLAHQTPRGSQRSLSQEP